MCTEPLFFENSHIHMYGVMIAIGVLCCFFLLFFFGKLKKLNTDFIDFVFYNGIASIAVGFFFAALFQGVYNYIDNPELGFSIKNGITFIGGLIGGVATFLLVYVIFRKKVKGNLMDIIDIAPCCILIAHAFGRIGCFFGGCCWGKETDSFLGIKFPDTAGPVHPTMLYEAVFLFILCAVCCYLVIKHDYKQNLSIYLVSYGIFRFFVEFLRDDPRGSLIPGISPSQFWSIIMVLAGIGLFIFVYFITKKNKTKTAKQLPATQPQTITEPEQKQENEKK